MSITDDFKSIVKRLRDWGFDIEEYSGCYGRSNGSSWTHGKPVWHTNHHYVCSLNPEQSYINSLVSSLANSSTVNWFADVNGRGYLLGTGPMNHAGTGNSYVLERAMNDQPNYGLANGSGDMSGNQTGSGTEAQHPGDSTPWPEALLNIVVAINAAEFLQWGYKAERAINHASWTDRKIDMSWLGGPPAGEAGGRELVTRVAKRMGSNTPTPPSGGGGTGEDWLDMVSKDELVDIIDERLGHWLPRALNVLMNGAPNQAFPAGSTIALDGKGISAATVDAQKSEMYGSKAFYNMIVENDQLTHQLRTAQHDQVIPKLDKIIGQTD